MAVVGGAVVHQPMQECRLAGALRPTQQALYAPQTNPSSLTGIS